MNKFWIFFILILTLAGCTTTQQGTSIGALTGAAIGGIIGNQ